MSLYPQIQKAMSFAGLIALLGNLSATVKKGDLGTLNIMTLGIFFFQQVVGLIVHLNYTSKINPSVWVSASMSSIVAGNVILFLMYLKVNGFGACIKVRECTEMNDATGPNLIKLPGQKELMYLGGGVALQLMAFNIFLT